jgi:hypothetical protein
MSRFLGIDFSGNHQMWRPGCGRSNMWIADVRKIGEGLVLDHLVRVQELPDDDSTPQAESAPRRPAPYLP